VGRKGVALAVAGCDPAHAACRQRRQCGCASSAPATSDDEGLRRALCLEPRYR
jgi:hypothetical protein